jgi:ABC-type multidrug transport system ATPase subunit
MGTLTVYETILHSALLRLPQKMSISNKIRRVKETMEELGIIGIANRYIGTIGIYLDELLTLR